MSNPLKNRQPESVQDLEEKWRNYDFTNVIGLLLLMQQIQTQERPKDPNVIMIAEDGTPYY
ncbi:MAG: hypothetical protein AAB489_03725 [Patescibacteria group bacterium]